MKEGSPFFLARGLPFTRAGRDSEEVYVTLWCGLAKRGEAQAVDHRRLVLTRFIF